MRGVGEVIVAQVLYGIVAIEGYFKFEFPFPVATAK